MGNGIYHQRARHAIPVEQPRRQQLGLGWFRFCGACTILLCLLAVGLPFFQLASVKRTWTELPGALVAGQSAVWNSFFLAAAAANAIIVFSLFTCTRRVSQFHSGFASSFLNCMQNGFNFLLRATSSRVFFGHTLVRQDRTFISTCASRNIGTAARECPVFREIVTPADGEALSHFGSGSASLGFRISEFLIGPPPPSQCQRCPG